MIRGGLLRLLRRWGARRPYFNIVSEEDGSLYMGRWWLFGGSGFSLSDRVPRDDRSELTRGWQRGWLDALIGFWMAARLHHIAREDRARDYHTHPAGFISLVLWGWYRERRPKDQGQHYSLDQTEYFDTLRKPWSIAYRPARHRNTITEVSPGGAWTIVIWFAKEGSWGFAIKTGELVNWRDYDVQP